MKTNSRKMTAQEDLKQVGLQFKEKLIEVGYEDQSASAIAAKAFPEMVAGQGNPEKSKPLPKKK